MNKQQKLECSYPGCHTPWAELQGDKLMVLAKHRGDWHVNVLTIAQLTALIEERQKIAIAK